MIFKSVRTYNPKWCSVLADFSDSRLKLKSQLEYRAHGALDHIKIKPSDYGLGDLPLRVRDPPPEAPKYPAYLGDQSNDVSCSLTT